jgi:hypothetical protein
MEVTNYNIKKAIIHQMPYLELFNEKIIHNKVHFNNFDFIRIIPKGLKGFLIFKKDKIYNYCYFIEITNFKNNKENLYLNNNNYKKRISVNKIYVFNCVFDEYLCSGNGTILYGTLCLNKYINKKYNYFVGENILYYKGTKINFNGWCNVFNNMYDCINNIRNIGLNNNSIIVSSTITRKIPCNINELVNNIQYDIYCIQYINNNNTDYIIKQVRKIQKTYFYIKPRIQSDIYEIYDGNNKNIGISYIPDYKTSVYLNSVFRTIKENINLDYLEESDDDEEFEDISIDKYVYLDKKEVFECVYNNKFNMWIPRKHIIKEDIEKMNIIIHKIKY